MTLACGRVIGRASGSPRMLLLLLGMVACYTPVGAQLAGGRRVPMFPGEKPPRIMRTGSDMRPLADLNEEEADDIRPGLVTPTQAHVLVFEGKRRPLRLYYRTDCPRSREVLRFANEEGFHWDQFGIELIDTAGDQPRTAPLRRATGGSTPVPSLELAGGFILTHPLAITLLLEEMLADAQPRRLYQQ
eukprot:GHVU01081877.1.p1 GENE.GHVU01081877.1~~GHVU01081877.1.p1  ORF type:complete len:188 (-),score=19.57 GHVU01081877.1:718-1281(-)